VECPLLANLVDDVSQHNKVLLGANKQSMVEGEYWCFDEAKSYQGLLLHGRGRAAYL
jgi:hypothetical protein